MKRALYYVAQALVVAAILVVSLRLGTKDLRVPFKGKGDALFWTVLVEATHEDGIWGTVHRLGAPFGTDMVDWNPAIPFDFTVLRVLSSLAGSAGAAINLYWLLSIVATGVAAAYAFRLVGIGSSLAFGLGTAYALLPYGLGQGVGHVVLVFHFVPLIAALAVRIAAGSASALGRGERAVLWGACALQGLSYVYYSFFSCVILAAAAALGFVKTRRRESLRFGALAILLVVLGTAVSLAPSFWYWHAHGKSTALAYKTPAMAELYGLKIRHLLMPNPGHPLAAFRHLSETLSAAAAPPDDENGLSRLGFLAAFGFLALLTVAVVAIVRETGMSDNVRAAAALNVVALLWAQTGGFGALWSALVVPDVRAYCRLVVFIAFFSLLATGAALSRATAALAARGIRLPGAGVALALCLVAAFDQAWTVDPGDDDRRSAAVAEADRHFVQTVEAALPAGAMVFQLPFTGFPVETGSGRMTTYDHGRGFLYSRALRWSWGGLSGRNDDWAETVAKLPPGEMVRVLVDAGFSAIWVDRWGYLGHKHGTDPTADIASAARRTPTVGPDDRVAVVILDNVLVASDGVPPSVRRERARRPPPLVAVRDGCQEDGTSEGYVQYRCGTQATLVVHSHASVPTEVGVLLTIDRDRAPLSTAWNVEATARPNDGIVRSHLPGAQALRYSLAPGERLRINIAAPGPYRLTRLAARDVTGDPLPPRGSF